MGYLQSLSLDDYIQRSRRSPDRICSPGLPTAVKAIPIEGLALLLGIGPVLCQKPELLPIS